MGAYQSYDLVGDNEKNRKNFLEDILSYRSGCFVRSTFSVRSFGPGLVYLGRIGCFWQGNDRTEKSTEQSYHCGIYVIKSFVLTKYFLTDVFYLRHYS